MKKHDQFRLRTVRHESDPGDKASRRALHDHAARAIAASATAYTLIMPLFAGKNL